MGEPTHSPAHSVAYGEKLKAVEATKSFMSLRVKGGEMLPKRQGFAGRGVGHLAAEGVRGKMPRKMNK